MSSLSLNTAASLNCVSRKSSSRVYFCKTSDRQADAHDILQEVIWSTVSQINACQASILIRLRDLTIGSSVHAAVSLRHIISTPPQHCRNRRRKNKTKNSWHLSDRHIILPTLQIGMHVTDDYQYWRLLYRMLPCERLLMLFNRVFCLFVCEISVKIKNIQYSYPHNLFLVPNISV